MAAEGKLEEVIKQKRAFLRASVKDYSAGGNDMLDDVEALLEEAKAEITHRLELTSCLKEDSGEPAWRKECLSSLKNGSRSGLAKPNFPAFLSLKNYFFLKLKGRKNNSLFFGCYCSFKKLEKLLHMRCAREPVLLAEITGPETPETYLPFASKFSYKMKN